MAIDPISNVSLMIEALRRQISASKTDATSPLQNVRQSSGSRVPASGAGQTGKPKSTAALERKLQSRINRVLGTSVHAFESATRVFVEGVLLWEFGEDQSQDPRFHQMIDDIVNSIAQDETLRAQFNQLFESMRT